MAIVELRRGWWECPGAEQPYGPLWTWFPWCLRQYHGVGIPFHALGHALGSERLYRLMLRLHMMGFLYAEHEGDLYSWQWRFWRGSPHARRLREIRDA